MIGERDDGLFVLFVAHFGTTQDHPYLGTDLFEDRYQLLAFAGIPDIDTESDDLRIMY